MTTAVLVSPVPGTLADLHERLGSIPLERIRCHPAPGTATEADVLLHSWEHFPNRELPAEPIPDLIPDLAVEVLSAGNTAAEMERKLQEYFAAGVRLLWYAYPEQRTVHVYTSSLHVRILNEDDSLDGGAVLPGFQWTIRE